MNQWRANTLSMIRKHALAKSSATIDTPASAAVDIYTRIEDLLLHLTATLVPLGLSPTATEPREKLRSMLESAANLAIELRVQRAKFTVQEPRLLLESPMDSDTMEDLNGGEEEDWKDKRVGAVAWPAVYKEGDENGENIHLKNLIFKAQVMLVD